MDRAPKTLRLRSLLPLLLCATALSTSAAAQGLQDFFGEEVARFTRLTRSARAELRVEGAQGFHWLRHHYGEAPLIPLANDPDAQVRLEAIRALGRCGGRRSIGVLVQALASKERQIRGIAHVALRRMTGQDFGEEDHAKWKEWLGHDDWRAKQDSLLPLLNSEDSGARCRALTALRHLGDDTAEAPLLEWIGKGKGVGGRETALAIAALERFGSTQSLPFLTTQATRRKETAWALGEIGGREAEEALLAGLKRFGGRELWYMTNLDRLHSANCERFVPTLLQTFGLIIYRSQTDELHLPPTARQRVAANLILRTGKAPQAVDLILAECEGKRRDEDTLEPLQNLLKDMRHELKPGFVRSDGRTVAQPLAALPHITKNRRFVPRLIKLLKHPAYIVRIYAATTLGALHAEEAIDPVLAVIRESYPFVDAVEPASGKHFRHSWPVRWRGFLCMALGRLGSEKARLALEELATNADNFRDIRYGAVVGLQFLGSPDSIPALQQVAKDDIIWMIRTCAQEAIDEIKLRREGAR